MYLFIYLFSEKQSKLKLIYELENVNQKLADSDCLISCTTFNHRLILLILAAFPIQNRLMAGWRLQQCQSQDPDSWQGFSMSQLSDILMFGGVWLAVSTVL